MSQYNSRFYSPTKFDNDQKDVLISQLKAEIFELRQNDRDFSELSAHLKNLEHRYTILSDEKQRSETEFRQRNDQNLKTIANLRTDIDTLKSNVTEKHIEAQELRAENLAIKEIADHRALDITRLKNELQHLNEINSRGNQERITLESEIQQLRDEKRKGLEEIDILTSQNDTLVSKSRELEKLIRELEYEKQTVEKQNLQLKSTGDNLDLELRQKTEQNRAQQLQIQDYIQQVGKMQEDIENLESLANKYKNESESFQKQANHESNKNFELGTEILNLETSLKAREGLIQDLKGEIDSLKRAHADAVDQNEQLSVELTTSRRNYDTLQAQNQELLENLEIFNEQDEQVRQILNRRQKVKDLKLKNESTIRSNYQSTVLTKSPKSRNGSRI